MLRAHGMLFCVKLDENSRNSLWTGQCGPVVRCIKRVCRTGRGGERKEGGMKEGEGGGGGGGGGRKKNIIQPLTVVRGRNKH